MKKLAFVEVAKDDNASITDICWPWDDGRAVLIFDDGRMAIEIARDTFTPLDDVALIQDVIRIREEAERYSTLDKSWLETANSQPVI